MGGGRRRGLCGTGGGRGTLGTTRKVRKVWVRGKVGWR